MGRVESDDCVKLLVSDAVGSEDFDQRACAKGKEQRGLRKDREEVVLGTTAGQRDGRCDEAEDRDAEREDEAVEDLRYRNEHHPTTHGKAPRHLDYCGARRVELAKLSAQTPSWV